MNHWLDNILRHLQLGETSRAGGPEGLFHRWQQASTNVIGKLCTGEERWQAAIRQIQAPVNFADALRTRTIP